MRSCAEIRAELVTAERGELPEPDCSAVARHLATCPDCAAEMAALRNTIETVAPFLEIEPSPDARLRLGETLGREFARQRAARRMSRWTVLVPGLAAAAAFVAAFLLQPGTDAPGEAGRGAATVATVTGPGRAVAEGLDWLAARQRADGAWSPSAESDDVTVAAVTASAVLAFAANGESARTGARRDALRRAGARVEALLASGFPRSEGGKPLYAQALGVRALAAQYAADRGEMPADERRVRREAIVRATRRLVEWQGDDGGFGYEPRSPRPDASCTLFAAAALAEVRRAGIADPAGAIARAGRFVERLRGAGDAVAYERPGDRNESPALTAAVTALGDDLGLRARSTAALDTIERSLVASGGKDALLAWEGIGALARERRPVQGLVQAVVDAQRDDGAWTASADVRCRSGGDELTTAFGVLALSVARN